MKRRVSLQRQRGWVRPCAGLALALALGGCGAGTNNSIFDQLAASPTVPPPQPSGYVPIHLPPEMIGKWVLAAPGVGYCTLAFSGAPGANEGSIASEGACPGRFAASRRWVLDSNTKLAIRSAAGETLVSLSASDATHFEGLTTGNEMITLTR